MSVRIHPIPSITFMDETWTDVSAEVSTYVTNDSTSLRLYVDDEPLVDVSVNLAAYGQVPPKGTIYVQNQYRGLLEALVEVGVLEKVGQPIPYGPFDATATPARVLI